ncbi:PREDICTED: putative clathrin assembly protein At2g25430 [Theobroma cacao]|uniref:Clathrin assembly protein At2g25430 n=1 Tax=Theobroma cacao TaxID=3641 RepID=A0AB32VKN3_THECC|nr:PREDICTED: putative clathrin assembly protein At2g25430 [Theobroma cacao]
MFMHFDPKAKRSLGKETMNRRVRQVVTALREHGSVSYAKIATIGGFCNVELIIVKATTPDDLPLPDRYVHELLKIFSISPSSCRAFSIGFSRRFGKTRSWRVALKCLLLLHRLLRSLPEDSPFRSELLWNRSNGFISLYPCRFQDASSSTPECYTAFIRSYAHLLDEALGRFSFDGNLIDNEDLEKTESLPEKMKEIARMLEILPQLQSLIDRVMDCRPTGAAAKSFLIQSAMKYIIRDSFICYTIFRRDVVLVLDNLFQMPYRSCIAAFGIYKKAALQANQLWEFYDWCRLMGFCGRYEYPFVDRIPQIQIQALETFINGMWQLTSPSSPTTSPSSSVMDSRSSVTEDDRDEQLVVVGTFKDKFEDSCFPEKFDGDEEREPLIQLDDSETDSWEDLLEASVNLSGVQGNNLLLYSKGFNYSNGSDKDEWKIQVYNPSAPNPFQQPPSMQISYAQYASSNPKYPWGL